MSPAKLYGCSAKSGYGGVLRNVPVSGRYHLWYMYVRPRSELYSLVLCPQPDVFPHRPVVKLDTVLPNESAYRRVESLPLDAVTAMTEPTWS